MIGALVGVKLAGDYLGYKEGKDTLDKKKAAAKHAQKRQNDLNSKKRKEVTDRLDKVDPTKRQGEFDKSAQDYADKLIAAINQSNSEYDGTVDKTTGRDKQSYLNLVKYLANERMNDASEKAAIMGRLQAPSDMRFNDRETFSEINNNQSYLNYLKRLYAATDQNKIDSIQPDDKKMFLSGLLSSAGQLGMMNALGTSSPSFSGGPSIDPMAMHSAGSIYDVGSIS